MQYNQQNARGETVNNSYANQLSNGQANSFDSEGQEAAETNEKVGGFLPADIVPSCDELNSSHDLVSNLNMLADL